MPRRWDFDKAVRRFREKKRKLPRIIGNMALNHYKKSFRDGGFTDNQFEPWKKRKRSTKQDRRTKKSRKILVQSGALRRSGRVKRATFSQIRIGFYGLRYARPHNRGLGPQPKRKFIGDSRRLTDRIQRRIHKELKDVFK